MKIRECSRSQQGGEARVLPRPWIQYTAQGPVFAYGLVVGDCCIRRREGVIFHFLGHLEQPCGSVSMLKRFNRLLLQRRY
ncbi:hypothetical protein GDO81_004531 [Engystomops pustulosus]|uniref:Uncharacterized protein n=1 Tax=Engystomops pustulosus TaxID=76066 RepID=A0AAV6ZVA5_ENGPU|nr:hypothetical protein GDO81_004531 [Engystomops pustulosus]